MTVAEPIQCIAETDATDADLLAAAANGDATALGQLATRYGPFIHAAALRQTGDPATADDVTQAVLIVLSKKAGQIAAPALPSWLHQTTRYAAANANRAAKRRRLHERRAARPEGQMDPTPDEINPLLGLLDEAIAKLADADRRAVVGRFLLGQDAATVATTLGVSPRAAQKRIERAVDRLRDRLIAAQRSAARRQPIAESSPRGAATTSASPVTALAITPAVVAAVLTAAAPSPASAAIVAVPTVAAASLAKQTAAWMTIAKVKAAVLAILPAALVAGAVGTAAVVALTPTTKPTPSTATSSPVVQVARPQPRVAAVNPQPVATRGTLKNGIWMEYAGVTELRNADQPATQPWFGVDGRPLATPPFTPSDIRWLSAGDEGRVQRQFAFRFDPARMTFDRSTSPGRFELDYSQHTTPMSDFNVSLYAPRDGRGNVIADDRFGLSGLMRPKESATVGFRIAAGPWVPRVLSRADADVAIVAENDVAFTFLSQPFEDTNEATVWYRPASFYSRPDVRLVAIDTAGQMHEPRQRASWYRSPQQRAEEPLLDKPLPEMRFNKAPFGEVIKLLELQGVPIAVKWDELKARHNVTPETTVTGRIGPDPLYVALEMLFQWVGDQGEPQFDVKDGVVTVRASDTQNPRPWPFYVPGLPLNRLDRFEVQTRNFDQWISFENLTAELGKPANLVIRTSDDPPPDAKAIVANATAGSAAVTLADGSRVQLVALGDAKTGESWRPDGTACAVPFGYEPQTEYPAGPGKRRIWAITVTRDSAGHAVLARGSLFNGDVAANAAGGFSSMQRTAPDGTIYQCRELLVDAGQQTVDWAVGVASQPTRKVSIERGPDGWRADVLGTLVLEDGHAAYVWGPQTEAIQRPPNAPPAKPWEATNLTRWQVWTPPSYGPRDELQMNYVTLNGNSPNGSMLGYVSAGGFHAAQCYEKLDNLQRVTMSVRRFDLAAVFRNVSLYPGQRSEVQATARRLEPSPAR